MIGKCGAMVKAGRDNGRIRFAGYFEAISARL
jgi:hypothetical protein